jgi:hypothetical protein
VIALTKNGLFHSKKQNSKILFISDHMYAVQITSTSISVFTKGSDLPVKTTLSPNDNENIIDYHVNSYHVAVQTKTNLYVYFLKSMTISDLI